MQHYVALMGGNDSQQTMLEVIAKVPQIRGFMKRYTWRDGIEEISNDLYFAYRQGYELIPMIEDKTFNGGANPAPDHIAHLSITNATDGFTCPRWHDDVRFAMLETLAPLVKGFFPGLGGIALQETAPSLSATSLQSHGYTPEAYAQFYKEVGLTLFPTKFFLFFNFIPQDQTQIDKILEYNLGNILLGGPDVWRYNEALNERTYPYYEKWHDKLETFCHVSIPSYEDPLLPVFEFARDKLHTSRLIWLYYKPVFPLAIKIIKQDNAPY
jgi:hypothetical protein